jgi:hypothetical protein
MRGEPGKPTGASRQRSTTRSVSSQGWIEPVDAEAKPLKEMRFATFNARAETAAEKPMFSRRLQAHALVSAAMAAAAVPRGRRGTHK